VQVEPLAETGMVVELPDNPFVVIVTDTEQL
jgi:hypothetical protein